MKRKNPVCPYLLAGGHDACGTDLCHLRTVASGDGGIIVTCGGFGSPAFGHTEVVHEGGRKSSAWVEDSPNVMEAAR